MYSKVVAVVMALSFAGPALAKGGGHYGGGSVHVRGYTRSSGTYVAPSYRTAPSRTKNDNYSTRGNTNPYTGKQGTKPRDGEGR